MLRGAALGLDVLLRGAGVRACGRVRALVGAAGAPGPPGGHADGGAADELNQELESFFGGPGGAGPGVGQGASVRGWQEKGLPAEDVPVAHAQPSRQPELRSEREEQSECASLPAERAPIQQNFFSSEEPRLGLRRGPVERHSGRLSHVDSTGRASMVDISYKGDVPRHARAGVRVLLGHQAFQQVARNTIAKGDVLSVARLAGIMAAKRTAELIPLCHPLALDDISVKLWLNEATHSVHIEAEAKCRGPTGVEMEALTAASVAGLTVYDMCKAVNKGIEVTDLRLLQKSGGVSGNYRAPRHPRNWHTQPRGHSPFPQRQGSRERPRHDGNDRRGWSGRAKYHRGKDAAPDKYTNRNKKW